MSRRFTPEVPAVPSFSPAPTRRRELPPIQRQTITGMTADMLRERILRGDLPEGEPLRQEALADELGVSRIPVREALRQLEVEGLVTFSPHRGAVVSSLSLDEIDELFQLRAEIECDLLDRASARMTAEHLDRAASVIADFEEALQTGQVKRWGPLNWRFHETLYAPANRKLTMGIVQKLHQHSDRYFRIQLSSASGSVKANEEHRAIVDALGTKDVARAVVLMRSHILDAGTSLHAAVQRLRNPSSVPGDAQ